MQPKPTYIPIKNWSSDDKPREKLLLKTRGNLSNAELIAILIGSGSRNESAVALAKRILATVNNDFNDLGKLSVKQLMQFKGIGEAKAVTIAAALEIGLRRRKDGVKKIVAIKESSHVFELLHPKLADLSHEEFWVVYLNNANTVLSMGQLSKGGITGTLVDVRLVLKQALELGAVGLILAHNHPSGTLKPSEADKQITNKLKTASQALDIKVLDHLIITQKEYFSFADEHIL